MLHNLKEERCSLDMDKVTGLLTRTIELDCCQGSLVRHIFSAGGRRYSLYLGDETR